MDGYQDVPEKEWFHFILLACHKIKKIVLLKLIARVSFVGKVHVTCIVCSFSITKFWL